MSNIREKMMRRIKRLLGIHSPTLNYSGNSYDDLLKVKQAIEKEKR